MCFKAIPEHLIFAGTYMRAESGLYFTHLKLLFIGEGEKTLLSYSRICKRVKLILQLAGQKDPSPLEYHTRAMPINLHTKKRQLGNFSPEHLPMKTHFKHDKKKKKNKQKTFKLSFKLKKILSLVKNLH